MRSFLPSAQVTARITKAALTALETTWRDSCDFPVAMKANAKRKFNLFRGINPSEIRWAPLGSARLALWRAGFAEENV